MRLALLLAVCMPLAAGCLHPSPTDAAQQQMMKEWDPEKVAQEYEKAGKHAEAAEIRRGMQDGQQ